MLKNNHKKKEIPSESSLTSWNKAFLDSQKMYRNLVEMAHDGITMVDMKGDFIFMNKQFAKALGYRVSELIGKSLSKLASKQSLPKILTELEKRKRGKKSRYEVSLIHKNGSYKYFWLSASPLYNDDNQFIGSMGVYSDITEKKIIESQLNNRVRQINTLYRIYGYASVSKPLNLVLSSVAQELVQAFPHKKYVYSKIIFDEKVFCFPTNLKRFFHKIKVPLIVSGVNRGSLQMGYGKKTFDYIGQNTLKEEQELIKNVADILSKHMQAREVLNHYHEIIKKAFTAIVIVIDSKIRYVNPRFYKMFKCKEKDVFYHNISSFLPDYAIYKKLSSKVKECVGKRLNGDEIDLLMITQSIAYHGKSATLIRVNDISDLKRAQKRLAEFNKNLKASIKEKTFYLEEANKRLKSVNKMKDEFIAITSHELRSPLTSIRGYLSFLVEDEFINTVEDPYHDYLMRAYDITESINYFVNNILDVSRLDMGRFHLQKQKVDIIKLLKSILNALFFQINKKHLSLDFENLTNEQEFILFIDSIRISQVFRNIFDNAIKFSKRGSKIKVSIQRKVEGVCISVSDQGMGIPKTKLNQIFDKFMQVKNKKVKYKGGVGLGLFIARRIVELHGGKMYASKNLVKGITIFIYLPVHYDEKSC